MEGSKTVLSLEYKIGNRHWFTASLPSSLASFVSDQTMFQYLWLVSSLDTNYKTGLLVTYQFPRSFIARLRACLTMKFP